MHEPCGNSLAGTILLSIRTPPPTDYLSCAPSSQLASPPTVCRAPPTTCSSPEINRVPSRNLGVTQFGQSGSLEDVHRLHGIDREAIVRAVQDLTS